MIFKTVKKRNRSAAGLLGRMFVDRLNRGLLIDRTKPGSDGKPRKKIAAPRVLGRSLL